MENETSSLARYSRVAIVLHWLIALLILGNFVGAWIAEDLPKPERMEMMGYHKANGILILVLTVLRIVWRLVHKAPAMVETLKAWEVAVARVTHGLLYFLMLAVPFAGWGLHSAFGAGKPVSMFGLFNMPALPVAGDKATIGIFREAHEIFATLMLALIVLHVAAALKHHFADKDTTLRRMVPWIK